MICFVKMMKLKMKKMIKMMMLNVKKAQLKNVDGSNDIEIQRVN